MEEGMERNEGPEKPKKYEFFSKVVRAGKRTYFFDVRASQNTEFYITITESKKCFDQNGKAYYEKHKIFLYPEDFEMFSKGLTQIISYVQNTDPKAALIEKPMKAEPEQMMGLKSDYSEFEEHETVVESYTNVDVSFDDLGGKK